MIGAVVGTVICLWWGIGALVSGIRPTTLPLKIDGCVTENNTWMNLAETTTTNISVLTSINNAVVSSPTSGYPPPTYPGQDERCMYINYIALDSHKLSVLMFSYDMPIRIQTLEILFIGLPSTIRGCICLDYSETESFEIFPQPYTLLLENINKY